VSAMSSAASSPLATFRRSWWPWLSIVARLVVGIVWIIAGVLKVSDIEDSVRSVRNFQILPEVLVRPFGTGLPVFEILIGALLVLGLGLRISGALSALLQLAFIIGIASAWARGMQIECGCFGGSASGGLVENPTAGYRLDIARDVGLFILSALVAVWPRSRLSLDDALLPPVEDES
jgi:uncharacterized membrane protein YphA (DoxX/SURF4 family)